MKKTVLQMVSQTNRPNNTVSGVECLAIIPARGGSKGIPHKNIHPLAGKPLIAYSIEQAHQSRYVKRVIVSTDDAEIATVSREYGAEVIWRPYEISGDSASSESALLHALEYLQQTEGYQPDVLVFLQCTSPLTLDQDIDGTVQALLDQDADSALAVIPFHYFVWKTDQNGDSVGVNHDKRIRPLRQEREPQYLESGAVYAMRAPGFVSNGQRFFGKTAIYVMPNERRLEIDEPVDFIVAEALIQLSQSEVHDQQVKLGRRPLKSSTVIRPNKLELLSSDIAALIFDFDGVFTDNRVVVFQDGREAVLCDRSDGWGIGQLKLSALPMLILSTESNPVVQARADKLGLPCLHGLGQDKWTALEAWLADRNLDPQKVVYVGNDHNDIACIRNVGVSVAVADADPEILKLADIVLTHAGGKGAVREICDLISQALKQTGP